MRFLTILTAAAVLVVGGCQTVVSVSLDDLRESEVEAMNSPEGLLVGGYVSDRGTVFRDRAVIRPASSGGVEFTPETPTPLFSKPVVVPRHRIRGVGRSRTNVGATLAMPLLFIPILIAGTQAAYGTANVLTFGSLERGAGK